MDINPERGSEMAKSSKLAVAVVGGVVGTAMLAGTFLVGAGFGALAVQYENPPTDAETPVLAEDDPGWDCETMGNGICGPVTAEADSHGVVVYNGDGDPAAFVTWDDVVDTEYGDGQWVHTDDVWNRCIEAADQIAEGDLPAGANDDLTALCEVAYQYLVR
jgi:hypothetical protein